MDPEAVSLLPGSFAGLAARIIEIRNQRGWTQKELARRTGLRPDRLCLLEKGARMPRLEEFLRLAAALGMDLHELAYGRRRVEAVDLTREIEALGSSQDMLALGRLLHLLLLGCQAEAERRGPC